MIDVNALVDIMDEICISNGDTAMWGCGPDDWNNPNDFEARFYPAGAANLGHCGKSRFIMSATYGKTRAQVVDMVRDIMNLARVSAYAVFGALDVPIRVHEKRICPCGIDSRDCDYHR
jgi:hypothetical protein